MMNNSYQKHKEKLQIESGERCQNLSEEDKEKRRERRGIYRSLTEEEKKAK